MPPSEMTKANRDRLVSAFPAALLLAGLSAMCVGCTGPGIPPGRAKAIGLKARTRPLLVAFEGLQPFSGHRADMLAGEVARQLDLAHSATSGQPLAHLPFAQVAHRHGQPIYLVGYSVGSEDARRLAVACRRKGIPIRIIFFLDAAVLNGKVPDNVSRVVFYRSGDYRSWPVLSPGKHRLADPANTALEVVDEFGSDHQQLPFVVGMSLRVKISRDLQALGQYPSDLRGSYYLPPPSSGPGQ